MSDDFKPDKARFKDKMGKFVTQSLFIEYQYNPDLAVYTLKDQDFEYEGVVYPSLRRLYMEECDPTEYNFATKYLYNWDHWQRLINNKMVYNEVRLWREEMEVKVRAKAVNAILNQADGNFAAAKWAADGNWNVKRGRPSKADVERERRIQAGIEKAVEDDSARILPFVNREKK